MLTNYNTQPIVKTDAYRRETATRPKAPAQGSAAAFGAPPELAPTPLTNQFAQILRANPGITPEMLRQILMQQQQGPQGMDPRTQVAGANYIRPL